MDTQIVEKVVEFLRNSRFVLVFTGAGISTGSGIPDFRGPRGIWTQWRPVYYQDFLTDALARIEHWEYKLETWKNFRNAKPNAAHLALAEMDRLGWVHLIVTQNIDGLHQLAGHSDQKVIELHGTNRWIECVSCGQRREPDPVFTEFSQTRRPPVCGCGGFLKPATVSFGQALPPDVLTRAMMGARKADVVLAVGSTLEVEPAASVPRVAKANGAFYAIVNQGNTSHDPIADVKIEGDAVEVLPLLLRILKNGE